MRRLGDDQRLDVRIHNEATGFVLASRGVGVGDVAALDLADAKKWARAARDGWIAPFELAQDDPFVLRVVVGELTETEEAEWIGRASCRLRVPNGELALCAGMEYLAGEEEDDLEEYLQFVEIPPGEYLATLYSHLPGVNGEFDLPDDHPWDGLMAWHRATRGEAEAPPWLALRAMEEVERDDEDGGEFYWNASERAEANPVVGLVLRLRPWRDGDATDVPAEASDSRRLWLRAAERRTPALCPAGLPVRGTLEPSRRASYLDAKSSEWLVEGVDVFERLAGLEPEGIEGGTVSFPVSDLWVFYRLPYYCNDSVDAELIIDLPPGEEEAAEAFFAARDVAANLEGRRLRVGFPPTGAKQELGRWLKGLAPALAGLPNGSRLEAAFCDEEENEAGQQRYAGIVQGGAWRIDSCWPAAFSEDLAEALAFCNREPDAEFLEALDEEEANAALDAARDNVLFLQHKVRREGLRLFPECPEIMLDELACLVFRQRFDHVWPMLALAEEEAISEVEFDFVMPPRFSAEIAPVFEQAAWATEGEVALRGASGVFRAKRLAGLGSMVDRLLRRLDDEQVALGFQYIGDLALDRQPGAIVRLYAPARERVAGSDAGAFAVVYLNAMGVLGRDCYSVFPDGSSQTTTTLALFAPRGLNLPEKKIYRARVRMDAKAADLLARHRDAVAERAATIGEGPLPPPESLEEAAARIDEFLTRSESSETLRAPGA
jgi:hypothetical protein